MHSASHNGSSAVIDTVVGPTTATAMNGLSNVSSTYVNPAQMSHNAQAGPSSTNGSAKKKAIPNIAKRRRGTDTPDTEVEPSHTTQQRKNRDGPRKKKANRACFHCQKAHLTCDDSECLLCQSTIISRLTHASKLDHVNVVLSVALVIIAPKVTAKKPNTFLTKRI